MSLSSIIDNLKLVFSWKKSVSGDEKKTKQVVKNSTTGDVVAGNKYEQHNQAHERHPFIEVSRGTTVSSQGRYEAHFYFRNVGDAAGTIQSFSLAGQSIHIERKTLTPNDSPYEIQRDLTDSTIRNSKLEDPLAEVTYKSLSGNLYKTRAKIVRGSMAVGTFNIDSIEDNELVILEDKK